MFRSFTVICLSLAVLSPAKAGTLTLDDWSINLAGAGFAGGGVVSPIDQIQFNGVAHNQTVDTNGNGVTDLGEVGIVDGLGRATQFLGNFAFTSTSSTGFTLNSGYEFTFAFSVGTVGTGVIGPNANFTHTSSGVLKWYLDVPANSALGITTGPGLATGITDGTQIAEFALVAGGGGEVNLATLTGSDTAQFKLTSAMAGVLFDKNGNDLSALISPNVDILIALAQSDFDLSSSVQNDTGIDFQKPIGWEAEFAAAGIAGVAGRVGVGTGVAHFAEEDGSLVVGVVPEPTSFVCFAGLGLVAGFARRRNRIRK